MKNKDTFYSYSIRLSAFLILHKQRPYQIITDKNGDYIFLFDNKSYCQRLLEKYRLFKEGK